MHRGLCLEPTEELNALSEKAIGAAIEVHRHLGPGFCESVYESALCHELALRGIRFERQRETSIDYKGTRVGVGRIDLFVDNELVVEVKAVEKFTPIHRSQIISYLKAARRKLGLLMNFNVMCMKDGIKRVVYS